MSFQKRKHPRIDSLHLLSYSCLNDDCQLESQGMGRTLNVSEGGILLETHTAIDPDLIISLAIGLDDDVTEVKGKVVFSKEGDNERFQTGVEFIETDKKSRRLIKKYIAAFLKHHPQQAD